MPMSLPLAEWETALEEISELRHGGREEEEGEEEERYTADRGRRLGHDVG